MRCEICENNVKNPVATTCGHLFCAQCLSDAYSVKQVCPKCHKPLDPDKIRLIYGCGNKTKKEYSFTVPETDVHQEQEKKENRFLKFLRNFKTLTLITIIYIAYSIYLAYNSEYRYHASDTFFYIFFYEEFWIWFWAVFIVSIILL